MRFRQAVPGSAFVIVGTLLAACQHQTPTVPPLPPQQIESGSTLTLLAPLTFPSGRSAVLFQGKRQVTAAEMSKNLPYCKLVPLWGAPQSLTAGPMKVGTVSYDEREAGDGNAMFSATHISLTAGSQTPGYRMSCGWPMATTTPAFLSTEQIYSAIGGQFTMQLQR